MNRENNKTIRNMFFGIIIGGIALLASDLMASRRPPSGGGSGGGSSTSESRVTIVSGIKNAENLLLTSTGRLFVSGKYNVYEVKKTGAGTYYKTSGLYGGTAACGKIVQYSSYIYTACKIGSNKYLLASYLSATPSLKIIRTLSDVYIPNGLAADSAGRLYLCTTTGRIIQIDFLTRLAVLGQMTWLDVGGKRTNGITREGSALYFTSNSTLVPGTGTARIHRVYINAGGTAGSHSVLYSQWTKFYDGIQSLGGGKFIIAQYDEDRVIQYNRYTDVIFAESSKLFKNPTAVIRATGPMFTGLSGQWYLVTERGGDRVSRYRFP